MSGDKRTVLTTGANSGIGLATVVHLAGLGFHSVGSVRSESKGADVAKAAASSGTSVDTILLDVTDAERCAAVIEELRPWAVVNNAGYSGIGAIEDTTDEEARRQLETMVVAPMRLARLALPHMRESGGGRVVNVSSIYGLTTTPLSGWYQACKHALEAASDALRLEVVRDRVRVVLIEPGGVKTGIWEELDRDVARHGRSDYEVGYERARTLLTMFSGVMGQPAGVARTIGKALTARSPRARYLVGPDARAIALAQPLIPTGIRDRITRMVVGL
ncbi:MAG TPA: SDR family NAD(P)-dependent oxidoreductase [Acidimicrobiales bacterium]|nr:SDR family NAD(P)-dependent oxidoreductase [Acidimicrobiales bacterium]